MTFDWGDYLNLATSLAKETVDYDLMKEAKHRTSISRAYYSSFHLAKNYVISRGKIVSKGAIIHKQIREIMEDLSSHEMENNRKEILNKISNYLHTLRSARNKADYDDTVPGIEKLAQASIIRAREINALIQQL